MSAPSKIHNIRLVELQFYDWFATTTGENRLAGVRCDAMGADPHMGVEQVSPHNSHDVEGALPKSLVREKPEVRFCVDHNNLGANISIGGAL